jgi:ubiquinone/menaquinone biosynthesis C-methylase UbiE
MKKNKPDYKTWLPLKNYTSVVALFVIVLPLLLESDSTIAKIAISSIVILFLFYLPYVIAHFTLRKNSFAIQHQLAEALLSKVPDTTIEGNALDIGTGNGIAAIKLAQSNPKIKVFGIDIWSGKWDYSKKQCIINANLEGVAERTAFTEGSGFDLPVKNTSMNLIISNYAIHTMKEHDKKVVFQEIIRALELNGYLVVQDFFRKKYFGDIENLIDYLAQYGLHLISRTNTEDLVKVPKLLKYLDIAGNSEIWVMQKHV